MDEDCELRGVKRQISEKMGGKLGDDREETMNNSKGSPSSSRCNDYTWLKYTERQTEYWSWMFSTSMLGMSPEMKDRAVFMITAAALNHPVEIKHWCFKWVWDFLSNCLKIFRISWWSDVTSFKILSSLRISPNPSGSTALTFSLMCPWMP